MNDENYAVNYMKFATDKKWDPDDALLVGIIHLQHGRFQTWLVV